MPTRCRMYILRVLSVFALEYWRKSIQCWHERREEPGRIKHQLSPESYQENILQLLWTHHQISLIMRCISCAWKGIWRSVGSIRHGMYFAREWELCCALKQVLMPIVRTWERKCTWGVRCGDWVSNGADVAAWCTLQDIARENIGCDSSAICRPETSTQSSVTGFFHDACADFFCSRIRTCTSLWVEVSWIWTCWDPCLLTMFLAFSSMPFTQVYAKLDQLTRLVLSNQHYYCRVETG